MKSRDNHIYVGLTYILSVLVIKVGLNFILSETLLEGKSLLYQSNVVYIIASIPAFLIGYYIMRHSILNTIGETYKISFYWIMSLIVIEVLLMILGSSFVPLTSLGFYFYLMCVYYAPILYKFIKRV